MPNSALTKPMQLTPELEAFVGKGPMSSADVMKNTWVYIKKHDLQNPANKRNILPDEKLAAVLGKEELTMFQMTGKLRKHMS